MKISNKNWRIMASECDTKCPDLNKLTKSELKDMLRRQETLIANRKFMNSLPDKGKKIFDLKEKLQQMIVNKTALEDTTSFLSKLSLKDIIDPKHPTLSVKKEEEKSVLSEIGAMEQRTMFEEKYDLYAVAIAETYKADLAESTGERFIPNKPNRKEDNKEIDVITPHLKSVNYYDDTVLKPKPACRRVKALSVTESLQLGKETKKKEQQIRNHMHKLGSTQQFQRFRSNQKDQCSDSSYSDSEANDDLD